MKKKILIVGGSSYVGRSLIKHLNKKVFNIYSTYNKNILSKKSFRGLNQIKIDLEKPEDYEKNIKSTKNFDSIVFLSGILKGKNLVSLNNQDIQETLKINLTSQIILLKTILKSQKKKCTIIFLSSISGRKGSFDPVYAASKGAINSLIKSLSKWEGPKIKCIGICSGLIKSTNMYNTFQKKRLKKLINENPNKEFVNADDLAKIIIDLTKKHWRHANGSLIDINGGVF